MTVKFECRTLLAMSPQQAFDRSRNIDAHTGSMAHTRERAVAGVTGGLISLGEQVSWRAVHFGVPLRMTNIITEMVAPGHFVDEQLRGPFRHFWHRHEFHSQPGGGTLMIDRISFTAPLGACGRVVERLVLADYMRRLITQRNAYLAAL